MSIEDQIRDNSCELRIDSHLQSRNDYMLEMLAAIDDGIPFDGYEDAYDAFHEYPLDINTRKVITVQISTGGPGDWLEIHLYDDENSPEIYRVEYHFNDWFDHASRVLDEKSPMYEYAERVVEMLENN